MSQTSRSRRRGGDERGIVLVLSAVAMIAILVTAAVVIDYGVVRANRQQNKSASDQSVMAGLRGLEGDGTSGGRPLPWSGVCQAIDYLRANSPELATLTGTYLDGNGATPRAADGVTLNASPCTSAATMLNTQFCQAYPAVNTWAVFHGTAAGGRIEVDIRSGYRTPDPGFPEDVTGSYGADNGAPALGGCDHLAVVVREHEDELFGGIVRRGGNTTVTRSVGRLTVDSDDDEVVALLMLELTACETLVTEGNNTFVRVRATPVGPTSAAPGLIHANSDGTGSGCTGGNKVVEASNQCFAEASCTSSGPSIVAENAANGRAGRVDIRAASGAPTFANTPACAALPDTSCTIKPVPSDRGVVTRQPVDTRYHAAAVAFENSVTTAPNMFAWSTATANLNGYAVFGAGSGTVAPCSALTNKVISATQPASATVINIAPKTKVYVNCNLDVGSGQFTDFDSSISEVAVNGRTRVQGRLDLRNVRRFLVRGAGGTGIEVQGGALWVNALDKVDTSAPFLSACTHRFGEADRAEVAKILVATGSLESTSNAVIHLCNAFVYLAEGPLPAQGAAPYSNTLASRINIGSQSTLDWKAPNQSDTLVPAGHVLLNDFEDMALWTEHSGSSTGTASGIGGQGTVTTTGVFFVPNANPFAISGGGPGAVIDADAQFIIRRLRLSGTVALTMAPNPNNAVPTPAFGSFVLVR